jgi:hypothetical protein
MHVPYYIKNMTNILLILARALLVITGLSLLCLSAGFFFSQPDITALWPWPDGRFSYIFIASVLAAIGSPVLWMGVSGELAAMRGGALDFATSYAGIAVTLMLFGSAVSEMISVPLFFKVAVASAVFNLFLYFLVIRLPIKDTRPVPPLLRGLFMVFFLILMGVGIALVMRVSGVFPWPLQPQTSVVFGWIFIGASIYFLYGFIKPNWGNMCGQLIGFMAYDAVLLVPFLRHFDSVKPEHQLSLYVYTSVLVGSALLSIYFLFLNPNTRFGSRYEASW